MASKKRKQRDDERALKMNLQQFLTAVPYMHMSDEAICLVADRLKVPCWIMQVVIVQLKNIVRQNGKSVLDNRDQFPGLGDF